ncbi:hypothetical protein O0L34_g5699 [Tuta absoluta]|nr:hypothetical protein O0L34_g5699 [Tuta absoluta]
MAQNAMPKSPPSVGDEKEFLTYKGEYKMCPLCNSHICLFLINFTDKMIMCDNEFCDFPFGYEKPKILKPGDQLDEGYAVRIGVNKPPSEVPLETSNACNDAEMPATNKSSTKKQKRTAATPEKEEEKIQKSIQDLARLNAELSLLNENSDDVERIEEDDHKIKNEKWIKNLHNLQAMSGVQLLRPEEMGLLKKEEPAIGLGELKINYGNGDVHDVPSISIEIHNNSRDLGAGTSGQNSEGTNSLPDE